MTSTTMKLPRRFLDDRDSRELPMPQLLRASATHYTVRTDDPALPDVLDDAVYYSDIVRMSGDTLLSGLQSSARATVKAIKAAQAS